MKFPAWTRRGAPAAGADRLERAAQRHAAGDVDGAIELYREALAAEPRSVPAARALAFAWAQLGEIDQSEYFTRLALELDPSAPELHLHLGDLLQRQGRLDDALESCREALRLAPQLALAWNNLGNVLKDLGRRGEAEAAYRDALALDAAFPEAHSNLGVLLHEAGDLAGACSHYESALRLKPDFLQGWLNLAHLHERSGSLEGALQAYDRALALDPGHVDARVNRAQHLLMAGRYEEGWREYEWRWKLAEVAAARPRFDRPQWDGRALGGEALLLYCEQGFGDAIQFVRYAPLAAARGARVLLRCPRKLKALFAGVEGVSAVVDDSEAPPEFAFCCPLLTLPSLLGTTTVGTIPAKVPYLRAEPALAAAWKEKLAARPGLKVGLAWATDSAVGAHKSLRLDLLAPLALPGVTLYSFQRGAAAAQIAGAPPGMEVVDAARELRDFSDDAALLDALDLTISIDTGIAHLAGAMARPVWTLVTEPPDWRWMRERSDSPWYPTMRLFRQGRDKDWRAPVAAMAEALAARLGRPA